MAKYEVKDGVGIIPEWATEIEDEAFKYCKELKSISIPPTVTEIGDCAFSGCSSLTTVKVSRNTKIADDAFSNCPNVKIERY